MCSGSWGEVSKPTVSLAEKFVKGFAGMCSGRGTCSIKSKNECSWYIFWRVGWLVRGYVLRESGKGIKSATDTF